jgi:hypothetical protein
MEPHRNLTRTGTNRSSQPRAERRRASRAARNEPVSASKHEIERRRLFDQQTNFFGLEPYEQDDIAGQVIQAALALPGDQIYFTIEHTLPEMSPVGERLQGQYWGCIFTREELTKDQREATGIVNGAHGLGYFVLVGSLEHGFKRPELKAPYTDASHAGMLQWHTEKFNKWRDDYHGPRIYKREELTIWPQTEFAELGFRLFSDRDMFVEKTAFIKDLAGGEPFPILDGWQCGTKAAAEKHGLRLF